MEVVIPPRDHGDQTDKYAWDEHGEVTQIQRYNMPSVTSRLYYAHPLTL